MRARALDILWTVVQLCSPAVALGNVVIVDSSGGGNFTQIQPAIDAAGDGDTILVESGTYQRFSVNNRSLAVVGDVGATVQIDGMIDVSSLDVDKVFLLQNISATVSRPFVLGNLYGISVHGNLGRVRIQDCQFRGYNAEPCAVTHLDGGDGCHARANMDVALVGCTNSGGRGATDGEFTFGTGGSGLGADQSYLTLYDSNCRGGDGGQCLDGTNGGFGLRLGFAAFLFGSNGHTFGGNGANSAPFFCSFGGSGGAGLMLNGSSRAFVLGYLMMGGAGGHGNQGAGCSGDKDGDPGPPTWVFSNSSLHPLSGRARTMSAASPAHAGSSESLTLQGVAGEQVTLYLSDAPDWQFVSDWKGALLLNTTPHHASTMNLGTIPSGGTLTVQIPIVDPGAPSSVLYLQPLFTDAQNNQVLGTPRSVVVLQ